MKKLVWKIRTGTCEQCGECCANGPWPKSWPRDLLGKSADEIKEVFPHAILFFGVIPGAEHAPTKGEGRVAGKRYPWRLHKDYGYVKRNNYECPFLIRDGDKRPCALYGTDFHHAWEIACKESLSGIPPWREQGYRVELWERKHPNCTFVYVEEG